MLETANLIHAAEVQVTESNTHFHLSQFFKCGSRVYAPVHEWEMIHTGAWSKTKASVNNMNVYEEFPSRIQFPHNRGGAAAQALALSLLSHIMHS